MYATLFRKLSKSKFRSQFKLSTKDKEYIAKKGLDTIRSHAEDFISKRKSYFTITMIDVIGKSLIFL